MYYTFGLKFQNVPSPEQRNRLYIEVEVIQIKHSLKIGKCIMETYPQKIYTNFRQKRIIHKTNCAFYNGYI
jgi:hypothetical protein